MQFHGHQSVLYLFHPLHPWNMVRCKIAFLRQLVRFIVSLNNGFHGLCLMQGRCVRLSELPSKSFQRRPKGLSLTITIFRRVCHTFCLTQIQFIWGHPLSRKKIPHKKILHKKSWSCLLFPALSMTLYIYFLPISSFWCQIYLWIYL